MSSLRSISRTVPPTVAPRVTALNAPAHPHGRSPAYRRLLSSRIISPPSIVYASPVREYSSQLPLLRSQFLPPAIKAAAASQYRTLYATPQSQQDAKTPPGTDNKAQADSTKTEESVKSEEGKKKEETQEETGKKKNEEDGEKNEGKKEDLPPPPPHGDKTPWQVFMETMQTEFKASKEWNDSTKQLAQGATDFVESESVRRAREAYEKTTGAVSSTAGKVLKGTAGAVGKGAAWTWETPVMKGVRKAANVTGEAIDKTTKPIRETEAFKSVKSVIDDGSSSRYGGWVDKEERKKQRELREQLAKQNGGLRPEVLEEDPKYVEPSLPLFLS